jgi:hypothetical protein
MYIVAAPLMLIKEPKRVPHLPPWLLDQLGTHHMSDLILETTEVRPEFMYLVDREMGFGCDSDSDDNDEVDNDSSWTATVVSIPEAKVATVASLLEAAIWMINETYARADPLDKSYRYLLGPLTC